MSETKPGSAPELKENKETEPKITVDFFYSYHGTDEDYSHLPEALKNADVYVPEAFGWAKGDEKVLNAISQGEAEIPPYPEAELLALYNLKIPVILVDTPEGHPSNEKFNNTVDEELDAYNYFLGGQFDGAMEQLKATLPEQASAIIDRENFIANELKKEIKMLTQKFPQLKDKKNIRVLVSLGALHTSLYKKLKPELQSSKMILGRETLVFSINNEIVRRLIRNPKEVISDNLCARSLIEGLITHFINSRGLTKDANKLTWASRKLSTNLSTDQIRSFSETIGESSGEMKYGDLQDLVIKKLEEMGVKIPTTEEEIDKLINLKKK